MVVLRAKVAMVGDGTVGKTAVTQMALSGGVTFPKNYMMTQGMDLVVKEITVDQNTTVELYIHDIGGQEPFSSEATEHLKGIDAFVVVFDISNKLTFEQANRWLERAKEANKKAVGVLLANKMDLKDKAEVTEGQMEIWAKNHTLTLFQSSALRGVGTLEPFQHIASQIAEHYDTRTRFIQTMQ